MSNLIKFNRNILQIVQKSQRGFATRVIENPEEYTDQPEYPEILDVSPDAKSLRAKQKYHEEYKEAQTIEEKLFKVNLPRFYGYKCVSLNENIPYDGLQLSQYCTRTDLKEVEVLPEFYKKNDEVVIKLVEKIKKDIEDVVGFEFSAYKKDITINRPNATPEDKERFVASSFVNQLNRLLINHLQTDYQHLNDIETDIDPRHEAFWMVGGIIPPMKIQKIRSKIFWLKEKEKEPVDRQFQYIGKPYLAIRHANPLPSLLDTDLEKLNAEQDGVKMTYGKYDPKTVGFNAEYRHGTTIPGFWPGNPYEFGLLSYQRRDFMLARSKMYDAADCQEALHAHGIHSSFAWLFAQACYQGFTTYNEITYPLTTQTIVTDGQKFSFYSYQMNTVLLHMDNAISNPRYNQCWGTKEMKLFEEVDDSGKVIGLNDDVIKNLIHFYINTPAKREDVLMKPYLDPKCWKIADIEDEKRRNFLETRYKYMVSNRPRQKPIPEIYLWEYIYKILHKTRPMERRSRFFELQVNPFNRRMDEHLPEYIPRWNRPGGYGGRRTGKSKEKYVPQFYPTSESDQPRPIKVPNYPPIHKIKKVNEAEYRALDAKYRANKKE